MTLDTQQTRNVLTGVAEYDAASESFSDVRALSAALRFLGEEADLSTVLAVSGEAFRSAVHAERWSIGSAYVSREPVLAAGARAFGYQPRYLIGASIDETWIAIRDAVDAGQPALSSGILARDGEPLSTWWFLVRGYDAQEKMVEVAGLPGSVEGFTPLPALHGREATWAGVVKGLSVAPGLLAERPVFLIGLRGLPPQPRDVVLETIQRAVRMAQDAAITVQTEMPHAAGRYVMGLSSYHVWANHLGGITGREPFFRCGPFERYAVELDQHLAGLYLVARFEIDSPDTSVNRHGDGMRLCKPGTGGLRKGFLYLGSARRRHFNLDCPAATGDYRCGNRCPQNYAPRRASETCLRLAHGLLLDL